MYAEQNARREIVGDKLMNPEKLGAFTMKVISWLQVGETSWMSVANNTNKKIPWLAAEALHWCCAGPMNRRFDHTRVQT